MIAAILAAVLAVLSAFHVYWALGGTSVSGAVIPHVDGRPAGIVLGLVFLARAVGDLRLVGFSKRVRGTPFARWDTWLYSPLCLAMAVAFLRIAL